MLGLRPRLTTRPSLIDLVTNKDTDRSAAPLDQDSLSIDLPESPIQDSSTAIPKPSPAAAMAPSRDVESQQGECALLLYRMPPYMLTAIRLHLLRVGVRRRRLPSPCKMLMLSQSRHHRREHDRCRHVRARTYSWPLNPLRRILR